MIAFLFSLALLGSSIDVQDSIDSTVLVAGRVNRSVPVVYADFTGSKLRSGSLQSSLPEKLSLSTSVVSTNEGGSGLGYSNIRVRGVGGYHTNVTLNGITLNDAESQEVFWCNLPALQSIVGYLQLQRGLGTSANGPAAFGASINMNTQLPLSKPLARFDMGYGSWNSYGATLFASSGRGAKGFYAQGAYSQNASDGYRYFADAAVRMAFADVGWADESNSVKFTFLQGKQHSGITWNGIPLEEYYRDRRYNDAAGDSDNYLQSHLQLRYLRSLGDGFNWSTVANYTRGDGFYDLAGDKYSMGNNLYVLKSDFLFDKYPSSVTAGAYLSRYDGEYWGSYYNNVSRKSELDFYLRARRTFWGVLSSFVDLHGRRVFHNINGTDEYASNLSLDRDFLFFNPRLGLSYNFSDFFRVFSSLSWGHREPSRADYQANPLVKSERLRDFELGVELDMRIYNCSVVLYHMHYSDILLETGKLNSQGYAIKDNLPSGNRLGLEFSNGVHVGGLSLEGNISLSTNRLSNGNPMLLSPGFIAMYRASYETSCGFVASVSHKFVGSQYWDNSGSKERLIPAYNQADISLGYHFRNVCLDAELNNIWNKLYYSYACSSGVFPAAPRNASVKLTVCF